MCIRDRYWLLQVLRFSLSREDYPAGIYALSHKAVSYTHLDVYKRQAKRNKDLLMSYGLVPVKGQEEWLERYEFLQQFLKESRQFEMCIRDSRIPCVTMNVSG